jgi:hypothetical protein
VNYVISLKNYVRIWPDRLPIFIWNLINNSVLMKVLFIQHRYPDTFWSIKQALGFISKKAVYPPMRLMTVSAMPFEICTR